MKHIFFLMLAIITLNSCEKVVDLEELNLDTNLAKVVIEGSVTNGVGPHVVRITKSAILSDTGANPTVDNAEVTISDNTGNSEKLISKGNGIYESKNLIGKEGVTYTLTAKVDNQIYTAMSTMPQLVKLDDIIAKLEIFGGDTTQDLTPVYLDPSTPDDTYRFILKINGKLIKQHFIINDNVLNGKVNTEHLSDLDHPILVGDEVSLTMQHVDKNVGKYYTSLYLQVDSGPGGGTTPNNPPNNISNGALGIFSAHTQHEKVIVIK
jgi:hypothetical protein